MSIGPFATEEDFVSGLIEGIVNAQPSVACFAVTDMRKLRHLRTRRTSLPAWSRTWPSLQLVHVSLSIGYIIMAPAIPTSLCYKPCSRVDTYYALDSPEQGDLGLRRIQWLVDPSYD